MVYKLQVVLVLLLQVPVIQLIDYILLLLLLIYNYDYITVSQFMSLLVGGVGLLLSM